VCTATILHLSRLAYAYVFRSTIAFVDTEDAQTLFRTLTPFLFEKTSLVLTTASEATEYVRSRGNVRQAFWFMLRPYDRRSCRKTFLAC
jgi:hypothetical protein